MHKSESWLEKIGTSAQPASSQRDERYIIENTLSLVQMFIASSKVASRGTTLGTTVLLVLFLGLSAKAASASWWGPPSCDSGSILALVSYEASSRYRADRILPGESELDLMLRSYVEFVPRRIEVISAVQVGTESRQPDAQLCKFEGRVYLEEEDAQEILRLANADPRIIEYIDGGLQLAPLIKFSSFLNYGYRSTLIYRTSYGSDGEESVEVLSEDQEPM